MKTYNYGVWLVLVIADAGPRPAARMRVWRALKAMGAAVVRDGVYLLPDRDDLRVKLAEQRGDVDAAGGSALLFAAPGIGSDDAATLRNFFDRSADYAALTQSAGRLAQQMRGLPESKARRALRALQHDYEKIESIDYFLTPSRTEAANTIAAARETFFARGARMQSKM